MTLTVYSELEQGSNEWLQARAGIITASTIGQLITAKTIKPAQNDTARALTETLVIEGITGRVDPIHPNAAMQRGNRDEPWARHEYEKATGATVSEVGFMRLDHPDYSVGYSPDGLVNDDGLTEFKSRSARIQMRALIDGTVPLANMAQLQTGLFVTEREWIDYVSYSNGMPLLIKRVYADPKWFETIDQVLAQFSKTATELANAYYVATTGLHRTEYIDHDAAEEDIY